MSERDLLSTDWSFKTDWKGNDVEPMVTIRADDPSGWEEPYFIALTLPEAKDFLRELQSDIENAEKRAKKIEKEKKATKAKEAA